MSDLLASAKFRRVAVDVVLVLFTWWITIAQWGSQGFGVYEDAARDPDAVGFLLVLATVLPIAVRRANPFGVLAWTSLTSLAFSALSYGVLINIAPTVALYTYACVRKDDDPRTVPVIAISLALWAATAVSQVVQLDADGSALTVGGLFLIGAWLLGDRVREGRRRRTERTQRTVAEERAHIGRELHDSAGHAINVILVQAGAARLNAERDPAASKQALQTVESVARETLGEIDRIVGALRADGEIGNGDQPLPGIDAIERLVQRHRDTELGTELEVHGTRRSVPKAVDQAAYRIVQEALTNAARHGRGTAHVRLDYGGERFEITVSNPIDMTRPPGRDGGGRGLVGMRERATLLGGGLDVSREGETFRVTARLPYEAPQTP